MAIMKRSLENTVVLVTGAEGFIGSYLTRTLYKEGAIINAIVYPANSIWRINDLVNKIKIYPVDLKNERSLRKLLLKVRPKKIFHLAADTDHSRRLSLTKEILHNNLWGTVNLLLSAAGLELDCFVNTGTCEEYGVNNAPFKETQRECPVSPYSASKVCATYIASMFHKSFGLPVVTLRPFLTYGPAQDKNMFIPSLIISCFKNKSFKMTEGRQTRELNYVEDVVEGFVKAAVTPQAIGEVINLGNGKEYMIMEVAKLVKRLTAAKIKLQIGAIPYRPAEVMRFYSDSRKAERILGWKAKTPLEEGLKITIEWYRKHLR